MLVGNCDQSGLVCPQFPYDGNDMIFWFFPIVPCHAFCMWHWPICKNLDLSFIWGHHHLHLVGMDRLLVSTSFPGQNPGNEVVLVWMISRSTDYFITCYTVAVLTRPSKVKTAVHGCNSWLSVWAISCRCPVKLSTYYQPCIMFPKRYHLKRNRFDC